MEGAPVPAVPTSGQSGEQPDGGYALEFWLNRATNPFEKDDVKSENVQKFCDQVNDELEGPQIACRLLAHKIQSPQEGEALCALNLCDACVRCCGQRFHNEIGKFRFLNELIKVLSPKYLGSRTSDKVRVRTIECLYTWSHSLPSQPKVRQAYDMLKQQGIVLTDPKYMDQICPELPPPAPKPKLASFEDEAKSNLLSSLLKSNNPDDLLAANRLIKSMVREEEKKHEKNAQRDTDLESLRSNASLLQEMLAQPAHSDPELELIKELASSLQANRPLLFRYVNEISEREPNLLADILRLNDDVGKALEEYKSALGEIREHQPTSSIEPKPVAKATLSPHFDVLSSDFGEPLGDDVLLLGGFGTPLLRRSTDATPGSSKPATNAINEITALFDNLAKDGTRSAASVSDDGRNSAPNDPTSSTALTADSPTQRKGLIDLDELSQSLIQRNLPCGQESVSKFVTEKKARMPLKDIPTGHPPVPSLSPLDPFGPTGDAPPATNVSATTSDNSSDTDSSRRRPPPLHDVTLLLEDFRADTSKTPVQLLRQTQGLTAQLHYAENKPRADTRAGVVVITSNYPKSAEDVVFKLSPLDEDAATVKQEEPTAVRLPPYNPVIPQSSISQVILLAAVKDVIPCVFELSYITEGVEQTVKGYLDF